MFADIEVFALKFLVKYKDKLLNDFMLLVQSGKIPCCHYYNHFDLKKCEGGEATCSN